MPNGAVKCKVQCLTRDLASAAKQADTIDEMSVELRKANSVPVKLELRTLVPSSAIAKHLLDMFA